MAVKQKFEWGTVDGRPFVRIEDWVATLPIDQQTEYHRSREQQSLYRQRAIDNGDMYMDEAGDYVWKDAATAKKGKDNDPIWEKYWVRWQKECGIVFCTKFIEE